MEESPNMLNSCRHQCDRAPFVLLFQKQSLDHHQEAKQKAFRLVIEELFTERMRTCLWDILKYASIAENKTRNSNDWWIKPFLWAQRAQRPVWWQRNSIFGNLWSSNQASKKHEWESSTVFQPLTWKSFSSPKKIWKPF